jgi:REP element-mobilizing transposase RayT
MARPLRLQLSGAYYHVLARGNARQDIFLDNTDRIRFLAFLGESVHRHGLLVHGYCLMPNHYHLIIETVRPEISLAFKRLNGIYSQFFNRRHERVGHVFQGRFKSLLIDRNSYFLNAHRYIHQNPVRKGLTRNAGDYEWSSCRDFLGLRAPAPWLRTDLVLGYYSGNMKERMSAYAAFVETPADEDPFKKAYAQAFLGCPDFVESMCERARAVATCENPERKAFDERLDPEAVMQAVGQKLGSVRVLAGLRQPARAFTLYLLREHASLSLEALARRFRMSPSGISHQVARVKGRLLQDRDISLLMSHIEATLAGERQISRSDPSRQAGILVRAS